MSGRLNPESKCKRSAANDARYVCLADTTKRLDELSEARFHALVRAFIWRGLLVIVLTALMVSELFFCGG